jgi:DNA invertase Pin-like site-specific DNA recombinase
LFQRRIRGIRILGCSDGYDSTASGRKLHRSMRGLINEIYLDDLRDKTHRGLAGQVERGFHAGGLSFGYRSVGDDRGRTLEIDAESAEWVLDIHPLCRGLELPTYRRRIEQALRPLAARDHLVRFSALWQSRQG